MSREELKEIMKNQPKQIEWTRQWELFSHHGDDIGGETQWDFLNFFIT